MNAPLIYESHSHTPLCKHADGWPVDYAAVAEERGLKGLIVTCHNPMPDGFSSGVRMAESEFGRYLEIIEEAKDRGIKTIAEHIEDANGMAKLWQLGINYVQGNHVQEPEVVLAAA